MKPTPPSIDSRTMLQLEQLVFERSAVILDDHVTTMTSPAPDADDDGTATASATSRSSSSTSTCRTARYVGDRDDDVRRLLLPVVDKTATTSGSSSTTLTAGSGPADRKSAASSYDSVYVDQPDVFPIQTDCEGNLTPPASSLLGNVLLSDDSRCVEPESTLSDERPIGETVFSDGDGILIDSNATVYDNVNNRLAF